MDIGTIEKNINLTKWFENDRFLDICVRKGKLLESHLTLIKKLQVILQEVYPDNWDIQMMLCEETVGDYNMFGYPYIKERNIIIENIKVVLYFDEITIKNGNGQSLLLKEFYTSSVFQFSNHREQRLFGTTDEGEFSKLHKYECYFHNYVLVKPQLREIAGARTCHNMSEYSSHYTHSHISGMSRGEFKNFCTGQGEIVDIKMVLNSKPFMDKGTLKLYFFNIKPFLEWESLGGVPHVRLAGVFNRSINGLTFISTYDAIRRANSILEGFKKHSLNKAVRIKIVNNKYTVVDDDEFEQYISKFSYYELNWNVDYYHCYKDEAGNYFPIEVLNIEDNITFIPLLFQGKHHTPRIENVGDLNENVEKIIHPKIRNYVKKQIEYKLNSERIKYSGVKTRVESSNA